MSTLSLSAHCTTKSPTSRCSSMNCSSYRSTTTSSTWPNCASGSSRPSSRGSATTTLRIILTCHPISTLSGISQITPSRISAPLSTRVCSTYPKSTCASNKSTTFQFLISSISPKLLSQDLVCSMRRSATSISAKKWSSWPSKAR